MIVLDTHAWIFLADDPTRLGKAARRAIAKADRLGVAAGAGGAGDQQRMIAGLLLPHAGMSLRMSAGSLV